MERLVIGPSVPAHRRWRGSYTRKSGSCQLKVAKAPFDTPARLRAACRDGAFDGPTSGLAPGFVQANMVILPADYAEEFRAFCAANPQPCPVLEELPPGAVEPARCAPGADLRTDLPRYRVFRDGVAVAEPAEVRGLWRDDLVTFLLGCSFVAEAALTRAGLLLPHIAETGFVPMYRTGVDCVPAGRFRGRLVVSMRPFSPEDAARAAEITAHYPMAHGAPVRIGGAEALGIRDLAAPEWGRAVTVAPGQVPVFWACGVTPQEALAAARPPLAITHAPGHMFVADITAESTRV
jgi:uncharacterized protein YcsI (UPF0317 family)